MNILYLVNYNYYLTKMSRVRFHGMNAVGNLCNVIWSGTGWDNYDDSKTVQENIDRLGEFDCVVVFKPLDMKDFKDVKIPKIIRYNEMFDINWTLKEIIESNIDLVICHHENDCKQYKQFQRDQTYWIPEHVKFVNIPHSAEKTIFKPLNLEKKYDVSLVGAITAVTCLGQHYPLRVRMAKLLSQFPPWIKTHIQPHAGGSHNDAYTDRYLKDFANIINQSKICITDSGAPKSRFGKYIEIPMCGTAIAADIPNEDQDEFRKFIIEINMNMSDNEIIDKIIYYINNDKERNDLIEKGLKYCEEYTQEKYAERFVKVLNENISQ